MLKPQTEHDLSAEIEQSITQNMPAEQRIAVRLESIFTPHMRARRDSLYQVAEGSRPHARFVHYTTAEAALNIIRTKRIWMRGTTCMADYREVQHGHHMLLRFFTNEVKKQQFIGAVDHCCEGAAIEAINLFDQWWSNIQFSTYISSISEHDNSEDAHGRLSMWRAFGGNTARVAIVLGIPWYTGAAEALNVAFSPVSYLKEEDYHAILSSIHLSVKQNEDFLRSVERPILVGSIFNMLVAGVTCLKHEGFHEEREWRAIYAPLRLPSKLMEMSIESVGGIPQTVYKLPLDRAVDEVLSGLDLASIFDRFIIGPSQFSWAMHEAFTRALTDIGVESAGDRVFISGIPIRS